MLTEVGAIGFVLRVAEAPEMDAKRTNKRRKTEKTFAMLWGNMDDVYLKMDLILIT